MAFLNFLLISGIQKNMCLSDKMSAGAAEGSTLNSFILSSLIVLLETHSPSPASPGAHGRQVHRLFSPTWWPRPDTISLVRSFTACLWALGSNSSCLGEGVICQSWNGTRLQRTLAFARKIITALGALASGPMNVSPYSPARHRLVKGNCHQNQPCPPTLHLEDFTASRVVEAL